LNNTPIPPTTVYLVDASIYIFQAHFSPYTEYVNSEGDDISALYGFAQFLIQFLRRIKASHIAIAHDESLFCGFRHSLCPNYKSNRELPDESLARQLVACNEICNLLGVVAYGSKNYEADDIIGTLASRMRLESANTTAINIVSRDKDLAQLLRHPKDCLWDYSGNRKRYWPDIVSDFGVSPLQIPDYLGLTGDAVDCISGVPGVGPVKARELLKHFESVEGVYANIEKVGSLQLRGARRLQAQLSEYRELAELSKRLATIVCDVQDSKEAFSHAELLDLQVGSIDTKGLQEFLENYGFHPSDQATILAAVSNYS